MKQKVRKVSIRFKILFPSSILLLLICFGIGSISYLRIQSALTSMAKDEATTVTTLTTNTIAIEKLVRIKPGDEASSKSYFEIMEQLIKIRKSCNVTDLYTLTADGKNVYIGVGSDVKNQQPMGETYDVPYSKLKKVFEDNAVYVDSKIMHDSKHGYYLRAYSPMIDASNKTVAAVGCYYDATQITNTMHAILIFIAALSVIAFLISLFILRCIINSILKNLNQVNEKIYDIVHNEGDLTQQLDISSGDETELIASNINLLLEHIKNIMLNISGGSSKLNLSSKNVVENLSFASDGINNVSATMEEMSAAMEEVSATLESVTSNVNTVFDLVQNIAGSAAESSASADEIMTHAAAIYENAVQEQAQAKNKSNELSISMNEQIERSQAVKEIESLTEYIIDISSQTNLLSLNASIEAARAGEAGRGFAVVADEIGNLATSSADAAAKIQQVSTAVISAVNDLASKSAEMLQFVDEVAMSGFDKLLETSNSYQNDVGNLSDLMNQFSAESNTIKQNVESINESIASVNIAVEESTKGVVNVASVSLELSNNIKGIGSEADSNMSIASDLDDEVSKFKLE